VSAAATVTGLAAHAKLDKVLGAQARPQRAHAERERVAPRGLRVARHGDVGAHEAHSSVKEGQ